MSFETKKTYKSDFLTATDIPLMWTERTVDAA